MSACNDKTGQYMLNFVPKAFLGEEDFMVTACNQTAYRSIKMWPYWQHFALNVFGPPSCGKTHLAHIWAEHIQKSLPRPEQIPFVYAAGINLKNVNKIAAKSPFLIVEDVNAALNEEAFFHLYNLYNQSGRFILFTSETPLTGLQIKLPDLRSRLNAIPNAEILQPDDQMLTALIAKLFNDRQIIVSQDILDYILKHAERSFASISRLIAEIDDISWTYGRAVSIPIVRMALDNLNKNRQLELFI